MVGEEPLNGNNQQQEQKSNSALEPAYNPSNAAIFAASAQDDVVRYGEADDGGEEVAVYADH